MEMRGFHIGIRRVCAVAIGAVLFLSGMLKLMDPVGSGLVMGEYFRFFHVDFLQPVSKIAGVISAMFETLLGIALVTGIWRRVTSIVTMATLAFFTILTLILLIANPDMSCGCFGEAFPLTHMQSFIKNLVLCLLACVAFLPLCDDTAPRVPKYIAFAATAAFAVAFMAHSLVNVPYLDFTEFARGNELEAGAFSFRDAFGDYYDLSEMDGNSLVVTVYDPERMDVADWGDVAESIDAALTNSLMPILVTPYMDGVPSELCEFLYFADGKTLMTFNRSNGGVTYVSDRLVVGKWARGTMPDDEEFSEFVREDPDDVMLDGITHRRLCAEGTVLACFAVMLLL